MKYFGEIITAAVLCGVISALSPEDRGGVGRFLKYLTSLVLLLALLSPLAGLRTAAGEVTDAVRSFFGLSGYRVDDTGGADAALKIKADALTEYIRDSVCERFGLKPEEVSVSVTLDAQELSAVSVEYVEVQLFSGKAEAGEVEAYLKELGFENCKAVKGENNA